MTAETRAKDGEYPVTLNELITSPRSVYQVSQRESRVGERES